MKLKVYYRKGSDHAPLVEKYLRDLKIIKHVDPEIFSVDDVESQVTFRTHDITSYPVIIVEKDSGEVQKIWQGEQMPMLNDISGYLMN